MNLTQELLQDIATPFNTSIDFNDSSVLNYKPYSERPETYIVPVVFLFIFISGVFGNISVIYIVIEEKLIQSPSYLYILNLSFGDLIVILGTVPFVCTIYTFESWPYGKFVCKASEFISDVSIAVSVFTLSTMSFDRYKAAFSTVVRTAYQRKSFNILRSPTGLSIVFIWMLAIVFAIPAAYNSFLYEINVGANKSIVVCYPFPPEYGDWYPKTIVLSKFMLFYIIPLIIIACCYISIALHLINKSKHASTGNAQFQRSSQRNFSRAKIVLSFVFIFMICFFPNHMFMIWFYFHPNSHQLYNDFWHTWRIVAFVLSFLNSCLNPITLYVTSDHFKHLCNVHIFHPLCKTRITRNETENSNIELSTQQIVHNVSAVNVTVI
ncbi:[Phe13]-bombesin receptor-like protein [Dinothrombium tinctorium]|uniref:[Phe13]-bombesin receptor-like protein n=1 Tax=Dinothrombium tinctorium TaxID=1965070 RepID=A0A3S3PSD0_9ACAR|nr:[Phe13]-bombesin receptor-like protein [Dinothrombium tinctorium]